jgi:hypothetical protein
MGGHVHLHSESIDRLRADFAEAKSEAKRRS